MTARLREILCFIFCRLHLLFTFSSFSVSFCRSYLFKNLHAEDKYTLSHQSLNMVELTLRNYMLLCGTFRVCPTLIHIENERQIMFLAASTNIRRPANMLCHVECCYDGISNEILS